MRGYFAVVRVSISSSIAYRSAYWFALLGLLLKVSLLYFFWRAVFGQRETIGEMNFNQMSGYVILSTLVIEFNAFGADRNLSLMVARGEIAVELVRPYSIIGHLLAVNAGQKVVELAKSGIALIVVGGVSCPVGIPDEPEELPCASDRYLSRWHYDPAAGLIDRLFGILD